MPHRHQPAILRGRPAHTAGPIAILTLAFLSLAAFSVAAALVGCGGETQAAYSAPGWFTDRGNLGHWASTPEELGMPLQERWRVELGAGIRSSVVGGAGHLLVGTDAGTFYALSPTDGSQQWSYAAGAAVSASATAVGESKGTEEYVWFPDDDGVLYALDGSDGSERWTLPGGIGSFNSATNYAAGRIFQVYMSGGASSKLRAVVGGTGEVLWESPSFNITTATPMHAAGMVVLGIRQQGSVYRAHDPATGAVVWEIAGEFGVEVRPSSSGIEDTDVEIGEPVRFFLSVRDGEVRAVRAIDGGPLWTVELPDESSVTGFAITRDLEPNILIVAQRDHLSALDPGTGDLVWDHGHDENPADATTLRTSLPALFGGHLIHLEGGDRLVARSVSDGSEVWASELDAQTTASPAIGMGTVYVGTSSGSLYAFSPAD